MLNDNEKAAVPVPPVGVGGEQPQINNNKNSITDSAEDCKSKNALEESLKKLREMQRVLDPSYLYTLTLRELYENVYRSGPPLVEDLLYPGTYLLAGAPKVGKSFLVAQIAYHISTGTPLWNYPQSPVLYLAMEDDYGRLQKRLYRMYGTEETGNLYFAVDAKSLSVGDQLENFLQKHKETRLIIIDTEDSGCRRRYDELCQRLYADRQAEAVRAEVSTLPAPTTRGSRRLNLTGSSERMACSVRLTAPLSFGKAPEPTSRQFWKWGISRSSGCI